MRIYLYCALRNIIFRGGFKMMELIMRVAKGAELL